ncbi:DUF3108 domain-containing protein [Ponticaulis sp.]|uniref:DUF3108 domain-containing protein n=1 Tax=Ponticaulis sp. TaxID=2020902 RepID=UPI000B66F508|nr:DUF3108 domain-containing protein [Ponticaulis sp.]MAI90976.1 hypothetical protein [Ponticaulis sp.]OUX98317.1 MAG: hypothetical protein CBB65_11065 [Hyphomonadaceae bacterium TMED5]|tara:strand:- start:162407 stop:163276 length:870 start_codon:yes stop_codon:yes gene_type:complete
MKAKLLAGLALATTALATPAVTSQEADLASFGPDTNPVLVDVRDGNPRRFIYELEATAYLLFIPITARASFDVNLHGDTYDMTSQVRTTGVADIFVDYDMQLAASGYVNDDGLRTYNYISQNHDGKKNRRVEMTYHPDSFDMVATPAFGDLGHPPATTEQALAALDPITALINVSFQPRDPDEPCGGPIRTFDGRQLTELTLEYIQEADIRTRAWRGHGIECHVTLNRVAGYNEGETGSNLSGIDGPMRIFFAEAIPGMMIPVKIVVDSEDIGRITLQTRRLELLDAES